MMRMPTNSKLATTPAKTFLYDSCPAITDFYDFLRRYKINTPTGSETWKNVNRSLIYLDMYLYNYEHDKDIKFRDYIDIKLYDPDIDENEAPVPPIFKSTVESMFYHKNILGNKENYHYKRALVMRDELDSLKTRYA